MSVWNSSPPPNVERVYNRPGRSFSIVPVHTVAPSQWELTVCTVYYEIKDDCTDTARYLRHVATKKTWEHQAALASPNQHFRIAACRSSSIVAAPRAHWQRRWQHLCPHLPSVCLMPCHVRPLCS